VNNLLVPDKPGKSPAKAILGLTGNESLVSKELFDKVQEIKTGHHKKHFKYAGLPFLYRSLIRCADCGCLITPERKIKKSGKTYHYYHCTQYNGKHGAEWVTEDGLTGTH